MEKYIIQMKCLQMSRKEIRESKQRNLNKTYNKNGERKSMEEESDSSLAYAEIDQILNLLDDKYVNIAFAKNFGIRKLIKNHKGLTKI